jgi:hypothetical protein
MRAKLYILLLAKLNHVCHDPMSHAYKSSICHNLCVITIHQSLNMELYVNVNKIDSKGVKLILYLQFIDFVSTVYSNFFFFFLTKQFVQT